MRARSKWLGVLGLGVGLTGLSIAPPVKSADHRDAPATTADPASDINDVYAFVNGGKVVLAMTVSPFATATSKFSNVTKYVFHVSSGTAFGTTTSNVDIICTFSADAVQKVSCWVGTADYLTGDATGAAGLTSASGKTKVFTGLRQDAFFFNLQGFKDTVSAVEAAAPSLSFNIWGCPHVDAATATSLQNTLKETTSTAAPSKTQADDFATANTLAIVVELDPSLVNAGGPMLSVWGSTNL